jgi:hypothetical protein
MRSERHFECQSGCDARFGRAIAAHFAASGNAVDERAMRGHLPACAACRTVYDRHLLLARLDPAQPSPEDRLARSLGLPLRTRAARRRLPFAFTALLGVTVAAAIVVAPRHLSSQLPSHLPSQLPSDRAAESGFAPRGPAAAASAETELWVFRIAPGSRVAEPAPDTITAGDELAFAYRNPTGSRCLMVFAIDEHRHIYWYHPEWSALADDPAAVTVSGDPGVHELPAAVMQHFDGEELMIHALFTDRKLTVRQVEGAFAAAAGHGVGDVVRFPDAIEIVRHLRVRR